MDNMDLAMTMNNGGDRDHTLAVQQATADPLPIAPGEWQGEQALSNTENTTLNTYAQPVQYTDVDYNANADKIHKAKVSYRKMFKMITCPHKRAEYSNKLESSDRRMKTAQSQQSAIMSEITKIDQKYITAGATAKPSVICSQMLVHALVSFDATVNFIKSALAPNADPQLVVTFCDDANSMSDLVAKLSAKSMVVFREQYERNGLINNIEGYIKKQQETMLQPLQQLRGNTESFAALGL